MKLNIFPLLMAVAVVFCGVRAVHASDPNPAPDPVLAAHTVKPGDPCHTNDDGVEVCNTGGTGDGNIVVDPKTGSGTSATTVDVKNDAEGTVSGIDGNDTVNVANGANVEISGTGGTVDVSAGGSTGSVTNTNPVGTGGNITIKTGSVDIHVPPGQTVNFG